LIRLLDSSGEEGAAELAARLGGLADTARERCYRRYALCDRSNRAAEARPYNALVQSWPAIVEIARSAPTPAQGDFLEGS